MIHAPVEVEKNIKIAMEQLAEGKGQCQKLYDSS